MKKLYLIRHAESEGNVAGAVQQGPTTPLSEKGEQQAKLIAERFKEIPIDRIISSPETRAKSTAEVIAATSGMNIEYSDLLIERVKPSVMIGLDRTSDQFLEIENLINANFHTLEWRHSDEENFLDLKSRAMTLLANLESLPDTHILLVTHGIFMVMVVTCAMFGEELTSHQFLATLWGCEHSNTGITIVKQSSYKGEPTRWKLFTWNDHAHLNQS